jgi:hypothetical protein
MLDAEAPSELDKDIAQALAATYLGDDESTLLSLLPTPEAKRSVLEWLRHVAETLRVNADGEELAAVNSFEGDDEAAETPDEAAETPAEAKEE